MSEPAIVPADPSAPEAVAAVRSYIAELADRFPGGFDPDQPVDVAGFSPPGGAFLVVLLDGAVVGCGGVRTLEPGVAEIKRMWIAPSARGRGIGRRLLSALEAAATGTGAERIRLDTSAHLPEAIALYLAAGYVEIDRYNDNPDAHHFFEKRLGVDG